MNLKLLEKYLESPAYDRRLTDRLLVQQEAAQNFFRRQAIHLECMENPVYFIENFLWFYEPRYLNQPEIEAFLFDYQKEVIMDLLEAEERGESRLYEKARDLGFTWLASFYFVWRWTFYKGWIGLFGSRKQEEVDSKNLNSFFGKVRFNIYKLPSWLRPKNFKKKLHDTENRIMNPDLNTLIQGESMNPEFGQGRRASIAVLDELFLMNYAPEIWRNVANTAHCRVAISTPRSTRFARTLKDSMQANNWLRSYHWSVHPFKDQEWYEQEKQKYAGDEYGLRQNLELDYADDPERLVYPQAIDIECKPLEYNPKLPVYVSMDWGVNPSQTVLIWWQYDGKYKAIEALCALNKPMEWYYPFLNPSIDPNPDVFYNREEKKVLERARGWQRPLMYFGEPAHFARAQTTATSIAQELAKHGIVLRCNHYAVAHDKRQAAVKQMIYKGVEFNDTYYLRQVLDALMNSKFSNTRTSADKAVPIHNEYADARAAVENFAVNMVNTTHKIKEIIYDKRFQFTR